MPTCQRPRSESLRPRLQPQRLARVGRGPCARVHHSARAGLLAAGTGARQRHSHVSRSATLGATAGARWVLALARTSWYAAPCLLTRLTLLAWIGPPPRREERRGLGYACLVWDERQQRVVRRRGCMRTWAGPTTCDPERDEWCREGVVTINREEDPVLIPFSGKCGGKLCNAWHCKLPAPPQAITADGACLLQRTSCPASGATCTSIFHGTSGACGAQPKRAPAAPAALRPGRQDVNAAFVGTGVWLSWRAGACVPWWWEALMC